VKSATRSVCCMLWITMTVHWFHPEVWRIIRDVGKQRDVRRARNDSVGSVPFDSHPAPGYSRGVSSKNGMSRSTGDDGFWRGLSATAVLLR